MSFRVRHALPARPDDEQEQIALIERVLQLLDEVLAGDDVADVHEHLVGTEERAQVTVAAAGITARLLAPVAQGHRRDVSPRPMPGRRVAGIASPAILARQAATAGVAAWESQFEESEMSATIVRISEPGPATEEGTPARVLSGAPRT